MKVCHPVVAVMIGIPLAFSAALLAQAPVPERLRAAETVYFENRADLRAIDELANRMREWDRVTLVDSRERADVVVVLELAATGNTTGVAVGGAAVVPGSVSSTGVVTTSEQQAWVLTILGRDTDEVLWSDREVIGGRKYAGINNLVRRLRERLEQK